MKRLAAVLLPVLLLVTSSSYAIRIYKWSDSEGVHYSDRPPPAKAKRKSRRLRQESMRYRGHRSKEQAFALSQDHTAGRGNFLKPQTSTTREAISRTELAVASFGTDSRPSAAGSGGGNSGGSGGNSAGGGGGSSRGSGGNSVGQATVKTASDVAASHSSDSESSGAGSGVSRGEASTPLSIGSIGTGGGGSTTADSSGSSVGQTTDKTAPDVAASHSSDGENLGEGSGVTIGEASTPLTIGSNSTEAGGSTTSGSVGATNHEGDPVESSSSAGETSAISDSSGSEVVAMTSSDTEHFADQSTGTTVADGDSTAKDGSNDTQEQTAVEVLNIPDSKPVSLANSSTISSKSKNIGRYQESVNLPNCDKTNPAVYIIKDKNDWSQINSFNYSIFCVAPGNYTYADIGTVQLRTSGTASKRRYLRWYDPTNPHDVDTHVADIPFQKQAAIEQLEIIADYWVIDRIVIRNTQGNNKLDKGAANNVINRVLIEKTKNPLLFLFADSSNNVLQNSILRDTPIISGKDSYAIYVDRSSGERIINNEIYNNGGGIQQGPNSGGNHIVYENEIYITNALYTDCAGNLKTSGACACSEGMAVVLKGTDDPTKSFLIEKNIIWGLQPHDEFCMGSGTPGVSFDLGGGGNPTSNVTIRDNIVLGKTPNGIYLGLNVKNVAITGNVVGLADNGIVNLYGQNIAITDNTYLDNNKDYHTGSTAKGTIYQNNQEMTNAAPGACFTSRKFTAPRDICLP